ncbi:MAG: (d)CMP kinase [Pseudomonadota bacterium]
MSSFTNNPEPNLASFVVALDGPAASGKGTLGRQIAEHYRFPYLDTGILYRGVAWLALDTGVQPSDAALTAKIASGFSLDRIKNADVRSPEVTAAASVVAAHKGVREALFDFQRAFAKTPPGADQLRPGAVIDGRDIGTVICPDAPVKLFVTATPEIRARRRWKQLIETNPTIPEADVLHDIKARDARDQGRADAPLKRANDAELIDTSDLGIPAAFAAARPIIDAALERWSAGAAFKQSPA